MRSTQNKWCCRTSCFALDTACPICLLCPLRTISANAVRLHLSLLAVTETCSEQSERNSGTGEYYSPKWSVSRAESELRINMRRATVLHASHGVRTKKEKTRTKFVLIFLWCGHRDLNSDGVTIRPSNVRVCLFRHDRLTLLII